MKRTFKLVYEWTKYAPNRKDFQRFNPSLRRAENFVTLSFTGSSATDKETILARCKMELGLYVNPAIIFEFDRKTNKYIFLKGETKWKNTRIYPNKASLTYITI